MHGLGNDFVVIDLITQNVRLHAAQIRRIADRHLGIGCDQVLLIEPPMEPDRDFFYRIYNADGYEVEQCGNGARCAARFFYDSGFTLTPHLKANCLSGPIDFQIEEDGSITVNMGMPKFKPHNIPLDVNETALLYPIVIEDQEIKFSALSVGNPHAVLQVPVIETAPVKTLGPLLAKHSIFPNGTNVEFMQIINRNHIRLRVFERGVGETMACGTGACAAVVAGIRLGLLDNEVKVVFGTGDLIVRWEGGKNPIYMTGPAISVYVGRFRL
jgi:diaminopimelate epimerase